MESLLPPITTVLRPSVRRLLGHAVPSVSCQCLHTTTPKPATPLPITAAGPPPAAPLPAASQYGERVDRRRRQAELLKRGQDLRMDHMKPGSAIKKRFWKDVSIKTCPDTGTHTIHLDTRPVRHPTTKAPLEIPPSKLHLATAIALEWDLLVSAQQALRSHLIPLTSIASRAHDIQLQDAAAAPQEGKARKDIVETLIRYLDTDTLLCWTPTPKLDLGEEGRETLREMQIRVAKPIISYLTTHVWPGVEIRPAMEEGSIMPRPQSETTRAVIKGWMYGLGAWELAGLERAVLAGKSLVVGARLVVEWSEMFRGVGKTKWGIEEAAEACSLEVRWQTGRWGEVEDNHDVEKEDLRRQMGTVVLVVSGVS